VRYVGRPERYAPDMSDHDTDRDTEGDTEGADARPRDPAPSDTGHDENTGGGSSLLPDADAGQTEAAKFSKDEKSHGRQDYGP
jgi:hypothetical protein